MRVLDTRGQDHSHILDTRCQDPSFRQAADGCQISQMAVGRSVRSVRWRDYKIMLTYVCVVAVIAVPVRVRVCVRACVRACVCAWWLTENLQMSRLVL